jgi:hypothetical protein
MEWHEIEEMKTLVDQLKLLILPKALVKGF